MATGVPLRWLISALHHEVILIRIVGLIGLMSGSLQVLGRLCDLDQLLFDLPTATG